MKILIEKLKQDFLEQCEGFVGEEWMPQFERQLTALLEAYQPLPVTEGKTKEALKHEIEMQLSDSSIQVQLYGNDGFDNQEKIEGDKAKEILKGWIFDWMEEYRQQPGGVCKWNDELLCDMLAEIAKWVKQENTFIPFEYLGILKEWLSKNKIERSKS